MKISLEELGSSKINPFEVCLTQVSPTQIGIPQSCFSEVRALCIVSVRANTRLTDGTRSQRHVAI